MPSSKENLIVDFARVELTRDALLLQEEIKQMHVENALLRDNIGDLKDAEEERERTFTE